MTALDDSITHVQAPARAVAGTDAATPHRLCVRPRAAALTIVADPTLAEPCRVSWEGARPTVRGHADGLDVEYTLAARMRALSTRSGSLTLALSPAFAWSIELRGGVAGMRADLRDLEVAQLAITGGACDVVFELPAPRDGLALRIEGGVSDATLRRPATVPVVLEITGGARDVRLDAEHFRAIAGPLRQRTAGTPSDHSTIALAVKGGASGLAIAAHDATA